MYECLGCLGVLPYFSFTYLFFGSFRRMGFVVMGHKGLKWLFLIFSFLLILQDGKTVNVLGANHLLFKDGYVYFLRIRGDDFDVKGKAAVEKIKGVVHIPDTEM